MCQSSQRDRHLLPPLAVTSLWLKLQQALVVLESAKKGAKEDDGVLLGELLGVVGCY